ncbi:MAG: DUF4185 domain-containing protein [bacterium]
MWKRFAAVAALFSCLCFPPPALADGGPAARPDVPPAQTAERDETAEAAERCAPWFPIKQGWLGGDAAWSVNLPEGRVLWLFGDTFIGRADVEDRRRAAFISNSIALSVCRGGAFYLTYYWGGRRGRPAPVFVPPEAKKTKHSVHYWPLDAFTHNGALYVFLSRVRTIDPDSPLGFTVEGVDLAQIENPELPPERWRITYRKVLHGRAALPGAAVLKRKHHVLLYTPLTRGANSKHSVALARLPYGGLDAPGEHLQFLARDGVWRAGFDARAARRIMARGATELSVQETEDGRFMAVMSEADFPADRIVLRTAPAPEGPWSEDVAVAVIPERMTARGERRMHVFCYAAKAWEPASRITTLMVTYVCNSTDTELLMEDMSLYRPRTRRIPLPEGL